MAGSLRLWHWGAHGLFRTTRLALQVLPARYSPRRARAAIVRRKLAANVDRSTASRNVFLRRMHRRDSTTISERRLKDVYAGDYLPSWKDWEPAGRIIGQVFRRALPRPLRPPPEPYRWRTTVDPLTDGMLHFIDLLEAAQSDWFHSLPARASETGHGTFASLREVIGAFRPRIRDVS